MQSSKCLQSDPTQVITVSLKNITLTVRSSVLCRAVDLRWECCQIPEQWCHKCTLTYTISWYLFLGVCAGGVWDIQRGPGSHGRAQRSGHDGPAYQCWLGICQRAPQEQEEVRAVCLFTCMCVFGSNFLVKGVATCPSAFSKDSVSGWVSLLDTSRIPTKLFRFLLVLIDVKSNWSKFWVREKEKERATHHSAAC